MWIMISKTRYELGPQAIDIPFLWHDIMLDIAFYVKL